jgi:hypothetical protein
VVEQPQSLDAFDVYLSHAGHNHDGDDDDDAAAADKEQLN